MKLWIPMTILLLSIIALCTWDSLHTINVLNTLNDKSKYIYQSLQTTEITDENLQNKIIEKLKMEGE